MRKEDLTDRRFGALVAKSYKYPRKWLCQCDCGNLVEVFTDNLTRGHTRSCGCKKGEMTADALTRHGKADSKVYNCWRNMKNRCYNSQSKDYPEYGGRGINVCDRWLESFANFYADMGDPPTPHHSIDRKDVDGDYCPANCRWVTTDTQANNKQSSKRYFYEGEEHTLAEWAKIKSVPYERLRQRVERLRWPLEKAMEIKESLR